MKKGAACHTYIVCSVRKYCEVKWKVQVFLVYIVFIVQHTNFSWVFVSQLGWNRGCHLLVLKTAIFIWKIIEIKRLNVAQEFNNELIKFCRL